MACQIQTDKYNLVVLNLIKLNPSVYNNFDNAAKFILGSPLSPEQKMRSVHEMAFIYKGLSGIDNKFYEAGIADIVTSAVEKQIDAEDYISFISESLGLKKPSKLKVEGISKSINALSTKKNITRLDLTAADGILSNITNYFGITSFSSNEDRESLIDDFEKSLTDAINEHTSAQAHKDFLIKQVKHALDNLRRSSSFIELSEIAALADLNTVLVTLTNGQMIEAIVENDELKVINPDNSVSTINPSMIAFRKEARVADLSKSNSGEQVFQPHTLLSSFTVKAINSDEQFELEKKLALMNNAQAGIKVHAVKLSDVADRRVQRIQEAAGEDAKYDGLKNRQHETFENATQIAALKSSNNRKIMTVSRPKASEQQFALVGEIIGTGEKFYIYNSENYVFVNSDNSTERVDFSNPQHLQLVKSLAVKYTPEGNVLLSDTDIAKLAASSKSFNQFKEGVASSLQAQFDSGINSVDITADFFNAYEASGKRTNVRTNRRLSEVLLTDPTLSKKLTVVTTAGRDKIVNKEFLEVPFIYNRVSETNRSTGETKIRYVLKSVLNNAQYIEDENGVGYTHEEYAAKVLGLNENNIYGTIVKPEHKNQQNIVLVFRENGQLGYRAINPVGQMENKAGFAKFMVEFADVLVSKRGLLTKNDFGKQYYTFKAKNIKGQPNSAPLYLNFALSSNNIETGKLQVEIRPSGNLTTSSPYRFISENSDNKRQFNFLIDEKAVRDLAASFKKGPAVKKVQEEFPALKSLDLSKTEDLVKFYDSVELLSREQGPSPSITELAKAIEEHQQKFAQMLIDNVINKIESRTSMFPGFMEAFKQDFTFNGVFSPEYLVADSADGLMFPNVVSNKLEDRKNFYQNTMNFKVVESDFRRFTIVSKSTSSTIKDDHVLAPITVAEKLHAQGELGSLETSNQDPTSDLPELPVFSLAEDKDVVTETDEERLSSIEWLKQNLPQFGIDNESLSELIALLQTDGTALGAFKDKIIYLNNALKGKGVVYHEAFHGVFRHILSPEIRTNLIEEVTSNKTHASKFTEAALKEFGRQRNYNLNLEELKQLQAEEILADGFQNYMLKNTKPRGIIGQLMALLKKLIAMFTEKGKYIDSVYGNIKSGKYKSEALSSGIFQGQTAYVLVPGLREVASQQGIIGEKTSTLASIDQDQIINMMAGLIIEDGNNTQTFSEKYDRIAKDVLDNVYNLDVVLVKNAELIAKDPSLEQRIIDTIGPLYSNYRFMLGARMSGEKLFDINNTGDPAYNERNSSKNIVTSTDKDAQDNNLGQVSYEMLKNLVLDHVKSVNNVLDGSERSSDKEVLNKELAGGNENVIANEDADLDEESSESSDFDAGYGEMSPLDSLPRQIRKFLTIVQYDQVHPQLGIKLPRMIAGEQLFSSLLQISADVDPSNIVDHIDTTADQMIEDGNIEFGEQIKAVYQKLKSYTNMVDGNVPTTNKQLYNMVVDVLHKTAIDYVMIKPKGVTQTIDEESDIKSFTTTSFTIVDEVFNQDVNNKRKDFLRSVITTYKEKKNDKQYLAAVDKLVEDAYKVARNPLILNSKSDQASVLETLTNDLHNGFKAVGLNFPKSLIRMSIMAIDDKINKAEVNIGGKIQAHYNSHSRFVNEKKYLEKEFFYSIGQIFDSVKQGVSTNAFAEMLDNSNSNIETVNRFNSILRKASEYIVKYDPSNILTTLRNAEGKPIYRYVSNTPVSLMLQSVRTKGLRETLEEDPYFKDFLENYYGDNTVLADLLDNKDTDTSRKVKLLLDNMNVALFGGVSQTIGQQIKEGKSFKNIDKKSLYITNMLAFLKRTTYSSFTKEVDADNNVKDVTTSIQTYQRSFSQLEASQTNFLVTGMYSQFANSKGLSKDSKGRLRIVGTLENNVKQELNRIAREWARKETNKAIFDAGGKAPIINNYNGVLNKEDLSKADVTDDNLRAYQFNKLADFFSANPELTEELISLAKSEVDTNKTVEKGEFVYDKIDEETKTRLLDALNEYAKQQFEKHLDQLVKNKVFNKVSAVTYEIDKNGNKKPKTFNDEVRTVTYYTSQYMPEQTVIDGQKADVLNNIYGKTEVYMDVTGTKVSNTNLEGLAADFFFNNWMNSLYFNEIIDGDIAMNVKDSTDYFKRNKKLLAAGSTMKEGVHRAAFLNTIKGFISDKYPMYGPYYSQKEIIDDNKLTQDVKEQLLSEFGSNDAMRDIFDGQSITTLMHQIDMHDSMGRLTPEIFKSLISKHYRELSEAEVRQMEAGKVVNNPKKTITASSNTYHKQSENLIDRLDVSRLVLKPDQTLKQAHDILHGLYMNLYSLRSQRQDSIISKQEGDIPAIEEQIRKTVEDIHEYFEPLPHRKMLHDILNSMEYHQVDQLMDTTASKNATRLPLDYFTEAERLEGTSKGYLRLDISSTDINNKYKFLQVETSGVKDKAKFSVQSKVLIAADIRNLESYLKAKNVVLNSGEQKSLIKIGETLSAYQESLKEIGKSNMATLKTVLRQDGDFQVGKIFQIIKASLNEQGAPTSSLKLFDLDASGNPIHSTNLPGIRNMLEYYFFSQYSKHVTDEKGSGFKNIHISSVGYDVLQDENGKAIFTEEYLKNPTNFSNASARPLGVTVEEVNGVKTYFVEAIMPKPLFKSKQHERFYMENLTKMFGVRIPTEDKRSMVAIKVVDFIDSSNLNGIILPHFVHLLAGSDFDVDALYGQTFAHYFDMSGNPRLYGQYDKGQNSNMNKFAEFIQYMAKDPDLKPLIKDEIKSIIGSQSYEVSQNVLDVLYHAGFDESDFNGAMNFAELKSDYDNLVIDIEELTEIRDEAREEFVDALQKHEVNPNDKTALDARLQLGQEVGEYNQELGEKRAQRNEYGREVNRAKRFTYSGLKATAILNVFSKLGLPVSAQAFAANPNYALSVRPIFQNKNLQAKLDIISNEIVFNNLYINERSSIEAFVDIVDVFGIDLDDYSARFNMYTPDGVIASKVETSMFKDGIGITANINKFLALASQYGLELNSDNVIWSFKNNDLEQTHLKEFGTLNSENKRVIEIIGNILGMFADGAKKPIPAALQMNEVNAGVTLSMIGVGLPAHFALAFNFLPELRNAVQDVQATKNAITDSVSTNFTYLSKEIGNQIKNITDANKDALQNLKNAGLIDPKSNPYKVIINKEKLIIDFNAQKLDSKALTDNTLRVDQIGFKVSALVEVTNNTDNAEKAVNRIEFTNEEQKIILLQLYKEQANQTYEIRKAGSIVNLFKKLNPSFVTFDRLASDIARFRNAESIFTQESTDRVFDSNQIWPELNAAVDDLMEQASKIFLERTPFFAPIKNAFESTFVNKANIAKIITSYVALKQYQKIMPGSRKTGTSIDALIEQDDKNLIDTFTPEYWFTNTLPEELEEMQKKYPTNKFLQLLRPDVTDNKAFLLTGGYVNERGIKMINKSKISGKLADEISDDANFLLRNENMFTKKLFYHELAKTGMQYKAGSFLQYLDPDMMLPLSGYIEEFIQKLEETKGNPSELISTFQNLLGKETSEKNVYEFFDELFLQMAYAATKEVGNTNIKSAAAFSTSPMSNIMRSLKVEDDASDANKKAIVKEIIERFSGQPLSQANNIRLTSEVGVPGKITKVQEFVFNMDVPKDIKEATKQTMQEIGKKMSFTYDPFTERYNFPMIMQIGFDKYLLNGVDAEISNQSFGKSIIDSIVGKGEYINQGHIAKYTLIPNQLTTGSLSSIGFSKEAAKSYMDYVSGKKKLDYIAPKLEKTVEKVETLPQSTEKQTQSSASKVIEGDIFAGNGIPVITTNLGGVHGAGLAQAAKAKGLIKQGDGVFKANDKVVQLPVKKVWSDNMAMNDNMELMKESLRSLIKVARENTDKTYLLPLAGLGHGEGNIESILPLLIQTVKASPNIKMVIPGEGVSLGRQGTVRRDYTRENLPMIKQMLSEAGLMGGTTKSQLQIDMDALNLTDEVITSLYNESSKRMSVEKFKSAAQGMIANLRATMSNEQILEKIKCL
jgi:hypothetical protein